MPRYLGTPALALATLGILTVSPAAQAQSVTLRFHTLPSAQGWHYEGTLPESSAFAVAHGKLYQTTVGKGLATEADYERHGIVDTAKPFTLTMRARVSNDEPNQIRTYGLGFAVESPTKSFSFSIEGGRVFDAHTIDVPVDTSVFHTYRLDGDFSTGLCKLWIDGKLVAQGSGVVAPSTNTVWFGDGTPTGGNANAEITRFTFVTHGPVRHVPRRRRPRKA